MFFWCVLDLFAYCLASEHICVRMIVVYKIILDRLDGVLSIWLCSDDFDDIVRVSMPMAFYSFVCRRRLLFYFRFFLFFLSSFLSTKVTLQWKKVIDNSSSH